MSSVVLDASALLAQLNGEPGSDLVSQAIEAGAAMSSVNLSEVIAKLNERGMSESAIRQLLNYVRLTVVEFDINLAYRAGLLRRTTTRSGLSFGDRACLALAQELNRPVLTTDRAWTAIDVGIQVQVIR